MKIMLYRPIAKFKALPPLKDRALIISCQSLSRHHHLSHLGLYKGVVKNLGFKDFKDHKSPNFGFVENPLKSRF